LVQSLILSAGVESWGSGERVDGVKYAVLAKESDRKEWIGRRVPVNKPG